MSHSSHERTGPVHIRAQLYALDRHLVTSAVAVPVRPPPACRVPALPRVPTKTQAVLDLAEVGACVRAYLMETGAASTIDSVVSGEGRGAEDWG